MKFKEFVGWCSDRACDGCWGMIEALTCIDLIKTVKKKPFWKRERFWKEEYERQVLDEIVDPINSMIKEMIGSDMESC